MQTLILVLQALVTAGLGSSKVSGDITVQQLLNALQSLV